MSSIALPLLPVPWMSMNACITTLNIWAQRCRSSVRALFQQLPSFERSYFLDIALRSLQSCKFVGLIAICWPLGHLHFADRSESSRNLPAPNLEPASGAGLKRGSSGVRLLRGHKASVTALHVGTRAEMGDLASDSEDSGFFISGSADCTVCFLLHCSAVMQDIWRHYLSK
jgi:hypothetical protein